MNGLRLISTDFDGTLVGHPSDGRCAPLLAEALTAFKATGGQWAINTGRSLAHTLEGLDQLRPPIQPDYLLTQERDVFARDARGDWVDLGDWNRRGREEHAALFHDGAAIFREICQQLAGLRDVRLIYENELPIGLVTSDEAMMEIVSRELDLIRATFPKFNYQRNLIYLRFCHIDYHKGAALGELSRALGLGADRIVAAGDHFNDLSMLDAKYAGHLVCPANAIPEVKAKVTASSGFISRLDHGAGTAEGILAALDRDTKKPANTLGHARRPNDVLL